MALPCLARLTDWEKTRIELGPGYVSISRTCKNPARKDESLCEECCLRVSKGCCEAQSRMMHGLLTEEPPASSLVYGSASYWTASASAPLGAGASSLHSDWLEAAVNGQKECEAHCSKAGQVPWLVQRPAAINGEMPKAKAKAKAKNKVIVPIQKGTILSVFPPIRTVYEESEKAPEKVETDSCTIRKEELGDTFIWLSEKGHVFDCDTTGEPGEFMGMIVNGELVASK